MKIEYETEKEHREQGSRKGPQDRCTDSILEEERSGMRGNSVGKKI